MNEPTSFLKSILDFLVDWTPLAAYVALVISGITLWFTKLRPFSLHYSIGSIHLFILKGAQDTDETLMIGLPVSLYNRGARSGTIERIFVTLEKDGESDITINYRSIMYYDIRIWNIAAVQSMSNIEAMGRPFSDILLEPRAKIEKDIMLGPEDPPDFSNLEPGKWHFTFRIKIKKKKKEMFFTKTKEFEQNEIDELHVGINKFIHFVDE